ncbi:MAG: F0F1 ATP synthase subunit B [Crocosphaera sp.]|nr:F0F1 ATP synthase subunit B [Crocosphaera sp.]
MLIDPFTTFAQILNFVILVFLLKKFLYQPIIKAMEERENNIMSRLQEAEDIREAAQKEAEYYCQKQQEWEDNKQNRIKQIKEESEEEKQELMMIAKIEVKNLRQEWYEQLQREKKTFLDSFRQKANQQMMKLARQILQNLADVELEQQIINKFIQGLPQIAENKNMENNELNQESHEKFTIRSTFNLSESQKQQLIQALQKQFKPEININFEHTEHLICGIELLNHGYKIPWNLEHYLDELETQMSQSLEGENNVTR